MKSIDTEYKGCLFRSRLEARWAIFFDLMGIDWEYEPRGFEMENHGKVIRYLPDFYLPSLDVYVEVKGSQDALVKDFYKIFSFIESRDGNELLLLGDIPVPKTEYASGDMWFHPFFYKGSDHDCPAVLTGYFHFAKKNINACVSSKDSSVLFYLSTSERCPAYTHDSPDDLPDLHGVGFKSKLFIAGLNDAYKEAKKAKFEHGSKYSVTA